MKIPQAWLARENAVLLVNAYLDGELDAAAALQVEQMIVGDAALKAEHDRLSSLRLGLAAHRRDDRASAALRQRVAAIGLTTLPGKTSPVRRFSLTHIAASLLLGMALAAAGTYLALTYDQTSGEVAAVVAAHERALLAAEPFAVASSDSHTVKPWFDAHVALSPQVIDLTTAGYPLSGGRIDQIDGKQVPVMIYQRRAHVISLLALPAAGSRDDGGPTALDSRDGYLVIRWHGRDFTYLAVSDLSPPELAGFVALLRGQTD